MSLIIAGDELGAFNGFIQSAERDQPFSDRIMAAESCVLHEGGPAGSQIPDGTVAEPAAVGLHVQPLGDREFSARILNVPAKLIGRRSNRFRIYKRPTMLLQGIKILLVIGINLQGELKLNSSANGQSN